MKKLIGTFLLLTSIAQASSGEIRFYSDNGTLRLKLGENGYGSPFTTEDFILMSEEVISNLPKIKPYSNQYPPNNFEVFVCEGRQYNKQIFKLKNCTLQ